MCNRKCSFCPRSAPDYDHKNEFISFELHKNGAVVQQGNTHMMLYDIPRIIEHCSQYFTLKIGDLIFSGTPAGVGPVAGGDLLEGYIEGKKVLNVKIR